LGSGGNTLIGEPTMADAIVDRLVYHAHRRPLKGECLRKGRSPLTSQKPKGAKRPNRTDRCRLERRPNQSGRRTNGASPLGREPMRPSFVASQVDSNGAAPDGRPSRSAEDCVSSPALTPQLGAVCEALNGGANSP